MQNEDQKLFDSMKSLEIFTGQEIQALQKTVVKRFETIEKLSELISRERSYKDRI